MTERLPFVDSESVEDLNTMDDDQEHNLDNKEEP